MKIVFLDIDGVLNSNFWNDNHQKEISDGTLIDKEKIRILEPLIKRANANIILHSGWRFWFDSELKPLRIEAQRLIELLAEEELTISGVTPDLTTEEIRATKKFSLVKADEILLWLKLHNDVTGWVVLDDLDLHNCHVEQHQVKTNPKIGLTVENIKLAEEILLHEEDDCIGIEFRKFTDYNRGIMYEILKDAYSFDERCAECWDENWKQSDDFFFDNPDIADKYGFVTCYKGEPIGFICWDPRNRPEYVEIGHNGIRTKFKRKGFGKAQLSEAVRRIKEYNGLKEIRVWTNSNLIAPKNYESVGFVLYDRKENNDEAAFSGDYLYYRIQL